MARKYYCSSCGKELTLIRKVVDGRILDLIKPHKCKGYPIKETDKPTVLEMIEKLEATKPAKPLIKDENVRPEPKPKGWFTEGDKRPDVKTTAPSGILNAVKGDEKL